MRICSRFFSMPRNHNCLVLIISLETIFRGKWNTQRLNALFKKRKGKSHARAPQRPNFFPFFFFHLFRLLHNTLLRADLCFLSGKLLQSQALLLLFPAYLGSRSTFIYLLFAFFLSVPRWCWVTARSDFVRCFLTIPPFLYSMSSARR